MSGNQKQNNFNFIRFILATAVIYSHAFPMLYRGGRANHDVIKNTFGSLIAPQIDYGSLAVRFFFALSGYLLLQSWENNPHLGHYIKNRILRIFPAFIVCSIVCSYVIGTMFAANPEEYRQAWTLLPFLEATIKLQPYVFGQVFPNNIIAGAIR